jgi:hypothetical protein
MHIKMKIIEVHPSEHSVVVRYFSDVMTEEKLATHDGQGNIARRPDGSPVRCRTDQNVNIREVPAPTGQALIDYVFKFASPNHDWFELQEKIADPNIDTSLSGAAALLDKPLDVPARPASLPMLPAGAIELRVRREKSKQIGTTVL